MTIAVTSTRTMANARPHFREAVNDQVRPTVFTKEMREKDNRIALLEMEIADLHATIMRMVEARQPRRQRLREICDAVLLDYPDVTFEDVIGVQRSRHFVRPRRACMAAVYLEFREEMSLPEMGRWFQRDHTTVLHNLRKAGVYTPSKQESPDA